jgi:hypothetical protein
VFIRELLELGFLVDVLGFPGVQEILRPLFVNDGIGLQKNRFPKDHLAVTNDENEVFGGGGWRGCLVTDTHLISVE